jgi:NtrC-family two-component system response regulator AlgB
VLDVSDFPATLTDGENSGTTPFLGGEYSTEEIEAEHIRQVLARKTSIQEAAQILKMDRSTLLRKRKSLNL